MKDPEIGRVVQQYMPGQSSPFGMGMQTGRSPQPYETAIRKPPDQRTAEEMMAIEEALTQPKTMLNKIDKLHKLKAKEAKMKAKREKQNGNGS